MHPTTQPMGEVRIKEKWSKLTYDQRMGVLVQTLQILKRTIIGYEKTINDLRRHAHDPKTGRPYTTNEIDGGYYGQESARLSNPMERLPIDDFDFEELKII